MPPAATTGAGGPGQDAMDLSIVLQLLKKGIVFIPLTIMAAIFIIRKVLVYPDPSDIDESMIANNMTVQIGDQNFHHQHISTHPLRVSLNNTTSNANYSLTFKELFFMINSGNISTMKT